VIGADGELRGLVWHSTTLTARAGPARLPAPEQASGPRFGGPRGTAPGRG
jgi:hypothetical protein